MIEPKIRVWGTHDTFLFLVVDSRLAFELSASSNEVIAVKA